MVLGSSSRHGPTSSPHPGFSSLGFNSGSPVISPEVSAPDPSHVTCHVLKHALGTPIIEELGAVPTVPAQLFVGTHPHEEHPRATPHPLGKQSQVGSSSVSDEAVKCVGSMCNSDQFSCIGRWGRHDGPVVGARGPRAHRSNQIKSSLSRLGTSESSDQVKSSFIQ